MKSKVSAFYLGITSRKAVMTGGAIAAPKLTDASSAEYSGLGEDLLALYFWGAAKRGRPGENVPLIRSNQELTPRIE